ncbi:MAG: citrate lyase ACP [Spirochaetia bacterium]|nr:citrate lyase ACP [Spirochaetia bacterium]
MQAEAGYAVKGDVRVQILTGGEPLKLKITSKVEKLYGDQIRTAAELLLQHYGIHSGTVIIDDHGALELVLQARMRSAVERLQHLQEECP